MKTTPRPTRLSLNRETLRTLTPAELRRAAGGEPTLTYSSTCMTRLKAASSSLVPPTDPVTRP